MSGTRYHPLNVKTGKPRQRDFKPVTKQRKKFWGAGPRTVRSIRL